MIFLFFFTISVLFFIIKLGELFMKDCLFCDIVNNKKDSYTLFEDDVVKVFLDVFPNSVGHTLIIPKKHFLDLDDISIDVLSHIMAVSKDIKKLLDNKLKPNSIVLVQNNGEEQNIKHYHLHLIPKYDNKLDLSVEGVYKILMED